MGNQQEHQSLRQRYHHVTEPHIELNDSEAIYLPNGVVSGSVTHLKPADAFVVLTGVVRFNRHRKKKHFETSEIVFFSRKSPLASPLASKRSFDIRLDEHLPPSFNSSTTYPNISYSISLVYRKSTARTHASIPIRVCPSLRIDQPCFSHPYSLVHSKIRSIVPSFKRRSTDLHSPVATSWRSFMSCRILGKS